MGRIDKPISLKDGENVYVGQLMRQARQTMGRSLTEEWHFYSVILKVICP